MLRLGIIGMSEGNGHPYSWSAIFNGFDAVYMKDCPFPVIPTYLAKQDYPDDFLSDIGAVTHIWTQDRKVSEHIAAASRIKHVVDDYRDMIGNVDAVLLTRDDAERHYEFSKPFLEAGLPVFIDKPLAFAVEEAKRILALEKYPGQIFTCSSFRFAKEFVLPEVPKGIKFIEAKIPKYWNKYAVHIIEPVLSLIPDRGKLLSVSSHYAEGIEATQAFVEWENVSASFSCMGKIAVPITINMFTDKGDVTELKFGDTFFAFRASLKEFASIVNGTGQNIQRSETLEIVEIIEKGWKK